MTQIDLLLPDEINVDNFAGGGGASTGIESAGLRVHIAINHDREAVSMHAVNHPHTHHYCEDVWEIDPLKVTQGKRVGLAWFSPDCKHFSKAKGGKPVSKKIRGLAWIVIKWAKVLRDKKPRVIMLENVEEFETWGPLTESGMPCPNRKGLTFRRWLKQLQNLGYQVELKVLRACDYGAPTIRKRLFIIARCDGQPIVWPSPTHGDPKSEAVRTGKLLPGRTAAECIDWSLPCPSIFDRAKPLAEATMRRIARGIKRYVIESGDPFIVTLAHGEGSPGGARRWGTGARDIHAPLNTVTASGGLGVVAPVLTELANASSPRCMPANEPLRTICANVKGGHHVLVAPTLVQTGYGERQGQAPRAPGLDKPLGTVVAGGQKHALVSAFLAKHYGGVVGTSVSAPAGTVTTVDHHSLVTAQLVGVGGRAGQSRPRSVDEPTATLTSKADAAIVASSLIKLRGDNTGQAANVPLATVSAQGTHHAEVRAFLVKYYSEGGQDSDLKSPMHTVPTKDRMGLVTVEGTDYLIADIGMRMLTPRELYLAQGFPENYTIDFTEGGKALTKTAQVRMCGNSVCPPIAEALVRANFAAEIGAQRRAA